MRSGHLDHEGFSHSGLLVDTRHRVIEYTELFRGTIDGASVYPREIVKLALEKGAAVCVLLHNHPSGVKDQCRNHRSLPSGRRLYRLAASVSAADQRRALSMQSFARRPANKVDLTSMNLAISTTLGRLERPADPTAQDATR